jgi:glycosyltransferase involved in cell wall biosynthesis
MPVLTPTLPSVTVAICTFNRAKFLRQTLAGITRQDYPADRLEVLVIDNNSTDDTRAAVAEFATGPHAPRHVFEARQGLDHARNRGIAEARHDIILFADDDILMEPDWVRRIAEPFMEDSARRIGCVGGEVVPVFPDGLPDWVAEWHAPLAFLVDAGALSSRQTPMGANMALPKWAIEKVGPFATGLDRQGKNLFSGGDGEMVRRVRAAGFEVWFAPAAAVRHQMPASRTTFRYAARHAFDSARSRVVDRAQQGGAAGYLLTRWVINLLKAAGFSLLSLLAAVALQNGPAKKSLVRAWRSCGYLYQIPRSLLGKI